MKPTCWFRNSPKSRPSTGSKRCGVREPRATTYIRTSRTRNGTNDTASSPRKARFDRIIRNASRVMGQKRIWWSGARASYRR